MKSENLLIAYNNRIGSTTHWPNGEKMMTIYLIVALIILFIAVIFALQNAISVTISFLVWEITGSLSLVLLGTLAVGLLIGWLVLTPSMLKNAFTVSSQRKRIKALEEEINANDIQEEETQQSSSEAP